MRIAITRVLCLVAAASLYLNVVLAAPHKKCSKPACDINAIGHRKLFKAKDNWYPPEKEKEMGEKLSAALEQKVEVVKDPSVAAYVDRVAQRIAQNSDADVQLTARVIRSSGVNAFTLPGGYLYVTTGLLLRLQTESDLATVLARGIAHVSLHSAAREQTRSSLLQMASVPLVFVGQDSNSLAASGLASSFGIIKFQRELETDADYFGIQYMYESGYEPEYFVKAVQSLWQPDPSKPELAGLSAFPPLDERVKALQTEINEILPSRTGAVVSTPEFDQFMQHLREILPAEAAPEKDGKPQLVHHDTTANN